MGVALRHKFFNSGILRSTEFDIPIICVGNITVGGTGKTPTVEMLVEMLSRDYNVAVLSRGYKRKTKGFVLAETNTSFKKIGDEARQIKLKYPQIVVGVCEKRVEGVRRLRELHPEVNLVILDDGFQHRYIEPWVNVVLMDYNNPIYEDKMLPLGRLRDLPSQIYRSQIVIITKCPQNVTPLDFRLMSKNLDLLPFQQLFFTHIKAGDPQPLFPSALNPALKRGQSVVVMTAIAKPEQFISTVEQSFKVHSELIFPDHYTFKMRDIERLEALLLDAPKDAVVLLTEKDAVKLLGSQRLSENLRSRLFYIGISHKFFDGKEADFERILIEYVSKNHKESITMPQ